jgi:hypothetical protein
MFPSEVNAKFRFSSLVFSVFIDFPALTSQILIDLSAEAETNRLSLVGCH